MRKIQESRKNVGAADRQQKMTDVFDFYRRFRFFEVGTQVRSVRHFVLSKSKCVCIIMSL
jgi:hypothetical protein